MPDALNRISSEVLTLGAKGAPEDEDAAGWSPSLACTGQRR